MANELPGNRIPWHLNVCAQALPSAGNPTIVIGRNVAGQFRFGVDIRTERLYLELV